MTLPKALASLASACGLETSYRDTEGRTRHASQSAVESALLAWGIPKEALSHPREALLQQQRAACERLLEPVVVAWQGGVNHVVLTVPEEAGGSLAHATLRSDLGSRAWRLRLARPRKAPTDGFVQVHFRLPALPLGYHALRVTAGNQQGNAMVISAPRKAHPPPRRRAWGLFAPLASVRARTDDQQSGTLADLQALANWAQKRGARVVATLPLFADGEGRAHDPSPYNPVSRCFWDEAYIDLEAVAEAKDPAVQRLLREVRAGASAAPRLLDLGKVRARNTPVLTAMLEALDRKGGTRAQEFEAYMDQHPALLEFAASRAAPGSDSAGIRRHCFAQWLMDQQLASTGTRLREGGWGLYLDLPVGSRRGGFDAMRFAGELVAGASMGAPPDVFFTKGQDWGFPPPHPERMRESGYANYRAALAASMRHAGVLRIDHVLGLHRLYWVPAGHTADDGVYVRYRNAEMYAILTLESRRHRTIVVGEDLGTVPPEVRMSMAKHGLLRSYVWQFEASPERPLPRPPAGAVASLNTHDAPTFAAWWKGADIDGPRSRDLHTASQAKRAHKRRAATQNALRRKLPKGDPLTGLLAWLDASPAALVLVNMEDLWDEEEQVNDPSHPGRPNWRRRHRMSLASAAKDPRVRNRLASLRRRSA